MDTMDAKTIASEGKAGRYIFAMDQKGRMYAADPEKDDDRQFALLGKGKLKDMEVLHHSSFLAEKDVSAAGELEISKGKLKSISNKSGHYKPALETTAQALQHLKHKGVDLKHTKVDIYSKNGVFTRYAGEVIDAHGNAEALHKKTTMLKDVKDASHLFTKVKSTKIKSE